MNNTIMDNIPITGPRVDVTTVNVGDMILVNTATTDVPARHIQHFGIVISKNYIKNAGRMLCKLRYRLPNDSIQMLVMSEPDYTLGKYTLPTATVYTWLSPLGVKFLDNLKGNIYG